MLLRFSRLHYFWKTLLAKRNKLSLIVVVTLVLVVITASSAAYYLANYSTNLSKIEPGQPQTLESSTAPDENSQESSPSGKTEDVKGVQAVKGVETSRPIPTSTPPLVLNPTTAPAQNYQTPNYQAPIIIYQVPTTSDSNSYTSPATDAQIERLHQQQEENAKQTDYCNQVREQRSAAVAPYDAKRTEILNQYNNAITNYSPGQLDSIWKQYQEADAEYWRVYNSFDTSCI